MLTAGETALHQVEYLVDDDSHLFTAKFVHLSDCLHAAASGTPRGYPTKVDLRLVGAGG
jgi:hypothetical protein